MDENVYMPSREEVRLQDAMIKHQESKLIEWMLDPSIIIETIKHKLKGEELRKIFKEDTNEWVDEWTKVRDPQMNSVGFDFISSVLDMRLSRIHTLSNHTDEDILAMAKKFERDMLKNLRSNYQRFEIRKENLSVISNMLGDAVFSTLSKSVGGFAIRILAQTVQRTDVYTDKPDRSTWKDYLKF